MTKVRTGEELRVLTGTSDQAKDLILMPDEMFHAVDNGARYVGAGQGGRARSLVMAEMNPDVGIVLTAGGEEIDGIGGGSARQYALSKFLLAGETIDTTGTTSMRAIIQRAVDQLTADYVSTGVPAQIVLPEGKFALNTNLTWKTGVGLVGAGMDVTKLVPLGNFAAIRAEAAGVYYEDCIFEDFEVDCSAQTTETFDSTRKGIFIKRLRRPVWRRVRVRNAAATAFGNDFIESGVYDSCESINSGRAAVDRFGAGAGFGIAIGLSEVESCVFNNCRSIGHGTSGLYLEYSPSNGATFRPRGIIANNFVALDGYVGICDAGATALQVNGGTLEKNRYYGHYVTANGASPLAGTQGRLRGVLISGNGYDYGDAGAGVGFATSAAGVEYEIDGCDIIKNAGHGVRALAPVALTVANQSQITDNGGCGVLVQTYAQASRLRVSSDCRIARNGQGNQTAFRDGVCIDAPTANLRIESNLIYDDQGTKTQQKAISLRGPHTSVSPRIARNDLIGSGIVPVRIEQTVADQTRITDNDSDAGSETPAVVTNLFTNPRFQVATTGTAPSNCTITRPADGTAVAGTNVLRATCTNTSLAQASLAPMTVTPGQRITFSASLRCNAGRKIGLTIKDNVTTSQYWSGPTHVADGNFRRVSFTWLVPAGVTEVRPSFWRYPGSGAAANDVLDVDATMWTEGDRLYPYFDGATNGGAWTGSADASTSTKTI